MIQLLIITGFVSLILTVKTKSKQAFSLLQIHFISVNIGD